MPGDIHNQIVINLIKLGKLLNYKAYSTDDLEQNTIPLPRTIDLTTLTSVNEIDVIWFDDFNFPKYAFEIELNTGVDKGMQRLYQLRHFRDCKLFIVLSNKSNYKSYKSKFEKLSESDPYNQISDRFSMMKDKDIELILTNAIKLSKSQYELLNWDLNDDILKIIGKEDIEEISEIPKWVDFGSTNWNRQFSTNKEIAKVLFEKFIVTLKNNFKEIKCKLMKYHISIYDKSNMISVVYTRRNRLVFQIKNIENEYKNLRLEMLDKPEGDTIIPSVSKYLIYKDAREMDDFLRLFSIALGDK